MGCPYGYDKPKGVTAMAFSIGDQVQLRDGRVGRIQYVNADGTYEVYVPADPVVEARHGHATQYEATKIPESPTSHVPESELQRPGEGA